MRTKTRLQTDKDLIDKLLVAYDKISKSLDEEFYKETEGLIKKEYSGMRGFIPVYHTRTLSFKSENWFYVELHFSYMVQTLSLSYFIVKINNQEDIYFNLYHIAYFSEDNKSISGYDFKNKECCVYDKNLGYINSTTVKKQYDIDIPKDHNLWDEEIQTLVRLYF